MLEKYDTLPISSSEPTTSGKFRQTTIEQCTIGFDEYPTSTDTYIN